MSLQAWYPLDGNIKNYGVGQLTPTVTTTPAYVNGGKIGAQALSTGGIKWTAAQSASVLNNTAISIAFWIKPLNTTSGQIFGTDEMSANNNRKFAIFAYPNGNDLHLSWMNDAASTTFVGGVWSGVFPINVWTHCCITYNNPTVTIYINGEKKATTSGVSNSSSFNYETQVIHSSANRYLNDFRVYNHCLTPREVRLLSAGMILHLPLKDSMIENTTNIVSYPTLERSVVSEHEWDKTLHANAMSASGWGHGYNGGVTNPGTGYHAHWQLIDNLPTMVFPNINSPYGQTGRWLGITTPPLQSVIGPNTTYTVSFDAKGSVDGVKVRSGYYYRITGATSNNFHDGQKDFTLNTTWKRYTYTYTTLPTLNASASACVYFYGHIGIEGISYIRNIQIELKDHATAYTKSSRTSTIMDCSGYQRHGVGEGNLVSQTDSARYSNCIYMSDARTNYGKSGTITMPTDQVTMSCWFKSSDTGYSGYHIPLSFGSSNYELSIDSSGLLRNGFVINGSRSVITTSHTSILNGKWHMITATYDGTTIRRYVDGKELTAYATAIVGSLAGGSGNLLIGNYNGTQYGNKNAYMSDVRVYSTALSAEDINILYQSRVAMLENGDIMSYEFIEDGSNIKFGTNGTIKANNFGEIGYINGMKTKVLSDGSAWARIHWLNVTTTKTWFTTSEVPFCNKANRFSLMGLVEHFVGLSGKYEFMLTYPTLSKTLYNRWSQTSSPNASTVTGFTAITTAWSAHNAGIRKHGSACVYNCDSGSTWYAPIGQTATWTTTQYIPAADGSSQTETELWVRIDNLPDINRISMFNNKDIQMNGLHEI